MNKNIYWKTLIGNNWSDIVDGAGHNTKSRNKSSLYIFYFTKKVH